MINLFYDNRTQSWEIATKGGVGGNYFYYRTEYDNKVGDEPKQKTFHDMFVDVFSTEPQPIHQLAFLEYLPKNYSYSFVLQHPENHIVINHEKPGLYLVAVYDIGDDHATSIPQEVYENWEIFQELSGLIQFPRRFIFTSYSDLENMYCNIQTHYSQMGLMFFNKQTGERASLMNPNYAKIKHLRGNNANLQYHYLCLRRIAKVKDFLHYFPQYKKQFGQFYNDLEEFIGNLHTSYVQHYVQKRKDIVISPKYATHIRNIHKTIYLPSLYNDKPVIVKRYVVRDYLNDKMTPLELLYHLNYDRRN